MRARIRDYTETKLPRGTLCPPLLVCLLSLISGSSCSRSTYTAEPHTLLKHVRAIKIQDHIGKNATPKVAQAGLLSRNFV